MSISVENFAQSVLEVHLFGKRVEHSVYHTTGTVECIRLYHDDPVFVKMDETGETVNYSFSVLTLI